MNSVAYVVDFGTSNSGIGALLEDGSFQIASVPRPQNPLGDEAEFTQPSWIYLDDDGQQLSGWDALYTYQTYLNNGMVGDKAHLVSNLKSDLGSASMHDGVFFQRWGFSYHLEDLIAVVINDLREMAELEFGDAPGTVKRLLLAHPVVFVGSRVDPAGKVSDSQHEGLRRLALAAEKAGFTEVNFYDEASASARAVEVPQGNILSIDFGGGTLDIAACEKNLNSPSSVLAVRGLAVGGNDIDKSLFEQIYDPKFGLDSDENQRNPLPNRHRQIRNLRGYLNVLRDPDAVPNASASAEFEGNENLYSYMLHMRNHRGIELYRNLMAGKSKLEVERNVAVNYQLTDFVAWSEELDQSHINLAFSIHMEKIDESILQVLNDADWTLSDIDYVVLSGGSSRLLPFRAHLASAFPGAKFEMGDSFTNVLEGLGVRARELWL